MNYTWIIMNDNEKEGERQNQLNQLKLIITGHLGKKL